MERRKRIIPQKAEIAGSIALAASAVAAWGCGSVDTKKGTNPPPEYVDNIANVSPANSNQIIPVLSESTKPKPSETAVPSKKKESSEAVVNVGDWQFRLEAWEEPNRPGTSSANGVPYKPLIIRGAIFNESKEPMNVKRIKNESDSDLYMNLVRSDGGVLDGSRSGLGQNFLDASGNDIYSRLFYKNFDLPPHFGIPVSLGYEIKPDAKDYKFLVQVLKSSSGGGGGQVYIDKGVTTKMESYIDKDADVKQMNQPVNVGGMTFSYKEATVQKGVNGMIERMHIVVTNNTGARQWSMRENASLLVYLKDKRVIYGDMGEFANEFYGKDIIENNQTVDFPILIGYERFDNSMAEIKGIANRIYDVRGATVLFMAGGNLWGAWKMPDDSGNDAPYRYGY